MFKTIHYSLLVLLSLIIASCSTVETRSGPAIKAQNIVVLPVESLHSELIEQDNQLYELLQQQIAKKKFTVIADDNTNFQPALDQALSDAGAVYDPAVGQFLPSDRQIYIKSLIDYYSNRQPVDVLILPELLIRKANVVGDVANWDGSERKIEHAEKASKPYSSLREARGLSIKLSAYSGKGAFLLQSYAGISVPYTVNYNKSPAELELKQQYMSRKEQQQAVDAALQSFFQQVKFHPYDKK